MGLLGGTALIGGLEWYGNWDAFNQLMTANPVLSSFLHSPLFPLLLFAAIVFVIKAENYNTDPQLKAKYLRLEMQPTTVLSLKMLDEVMALHGKTTYKIECDVLAEIYVVNESDTEVTLEDVRASLFIRRHKRIPKTWFPKKTVPLALAKGFGQYSLKKDNGGSLEYSHPISLFVPDQPLRKGLPRRGWLILRTDQLQKSEAEGDVEIKVRLIDSLGHSHEVESIAGRIESPEDSPKIFRSVLS